MAIINIVVGSAETPTKEAAWAAIPANTIGLGNKYNILFQGKFTATTQWVLSGKTTEPGTITIGAVAGKSYLDNPNILTTPYTYNPANGAAYEANIGYIDGMIKVDTPYITFRGMQFRNANGDGDSALRFTPNATDCIIDRCIIDSSVNYSSSYTLRAGGRRLRVISTLIQHNSDQADVAYIDYDGCSFENVDFIRPSTFGKKNYAVSCYGGNSFKNCRGFGVLNFTPAADSAGDHNACTGAISFGSNNLQNLVFADQVVNPDSDFRAKAGAATIDAGAAPSSDNTSAPNGIRQQGTSTDIGSWEYPSVIQAPTAKVTNISVIGTKVTISGTTTGIPTSGTASITPTASPPYNYGQAKGPAEISFGTGSFSVEFDGVSVGEYAFGYVVENANYPVQGENPLGTFKIVSSQATTIVQEPIDGQVLHIHGTTSGNPTSGVLIVPASSTDPQGATDKTASLLLGAGTFSVSITLPSGNFDRGLLLLTDANGTSLPQPGTRPVYIQPISGNPEIPGGEVPSPTPTISGVTVTPTTATGSTKFSASVQGTNNPPQTVSWEATAGQITSDGDFTAPAPKNAVQTITVTATSAVDNNHKGMATVTIAAAGTPVPTVTGVLVAPATATVAGGATKQFAATVSGLNSPPQTVAWSVDKGSINSSGLFTAPSAGGDQQAITVTATSVADSSKSGAATVIVPAIASVAQRAVTITFGDTTGALANLTGIKVAVFDEATPDLRNAPVYKSASATTNASGVMTLTIQSMRSVGDLCGVSVQLADGRNFDVSTPVS